MEKVFSKEKYIEVMGIETYEKSIYPVVGSYVDKCDGLTEEEMEELGYLTDEKWMIEKEENMKEDTFSLDADISDDFIENINKLFEINENKEYVVGLDCGNGKSIQVKGHFKVNTNVLYKRKKVGKRYKFYKTYSFPFSEMTFIGNEIIHI